MYKVFIYNKPIYFAEQAELTNLSKNERTYSCENEQDKLGILSIHRTTNPDSPLYVTNNNLDKLTKIFFGDHKKIEAAGGVVINKHNEILFIDRLGYWDLPKGKVEKNEELRIAAIREVEEECGINNPSIEKKLLETYHTYAAKGKNYFKTTHWYLMSYAGDENLTPQIEEGITDVRWVKKEKMEKQIARTYNSILDVLEVI
jgi:8-oxo-dGTP pyrophosphatase MutT (NUDIX family)